MGKWPNRKTKRMKQLEVQLGEPVEKVLYKLYIKQGLTVEEIGQRWGIHFSTVALWIRRFNINPDDTNKKKHPDLSVIND